MKTLSVQQTKSSMLHTIFVLAWPTMLEQLMQTAVQYIDTAMVGTLGTHATAAVGATTTVNWLINSTVSALGIGFLSFIARALGAGEERQARKIAAQTVFLVLVVGSLFTVLPLTLSARVPVWMQVEPAIRALAAQYFFILYSPMLLRTATIIFGTVLRAGGDTKTPMLVGLLVNIVNVILNFLMIYPTRTATLFARTVTIPGMGLGVAGAAAASAIAFAVGGICITIAFWRHPTLSPKDERLMPDFQILRPCLKVALPNMLQRFATSLGYVAFASMINSLGEISTAAHTIANTVESAFYIPGYGMQTAAATLAGNAMGAKDPKKMRSLTVTIITIEVTLMVLSGTLLFLFAPQMMHLFSTSGEVIALGSTVLRMVAVSEPFFGVAIIIEGILQGTGNTMIPFLFSVLGMWTVRIGGTFLCTQLLGLGLPAAWACMISHNLLLFFLFVVYCLRSRRSPLHFEMTA